MCAKKRDIYLMSNGQPVTEGSVSTLCGVLDKPGLVYWSANKAVEAVADLWKPGQAYEKTYIDMALQQAKNAHRVAKDTAGDIGTRAHLIVGAYVEGQLRPEDVSDPRERRSLENFIRVTQGWEWLGSEITLVSEWCECGCGVYPHDPRHIVGAVCPTCNKVFTLYGYGGTADAIARVNGKVLLIDFKTSNTVQATYSMQCALYAQATPVGDAAPLAEVWREIEEARILHFDKDLLTWECLERDIKEQVPFIPHFIGCARWKRRFEQKSFSTYHEKKVSVSGDTISISSSAPPVFEKQEPKDSIFFV